MVILLKRIFRQGLKNIKRQGTMTGAAIVLTGVALFLIGFLFFLQGFTSHVVTQLRNQIDVNVYFKEDATENEIFAAKEELQKLPEVKQVEYISPEKALEDFKTKFSEDKVIMDSLAEIGRNPLLAALNVRVWEPPQYAAVVNYLEASSFQSLIESIDYRQNRELIERLSAITSGAIRSVLALGIILGILAFLVMFNAIRLAIANSQKEIEVMHLVGADKLFIVGPFLVQGAFMGFVAGLATLVFFGFVSFLVGKPLESWTAGFHPFHYFLNNFLLLFSLQVVLGSFFGIVSAWLAARRYLK
jgi:cell division transport system permease protein